MGFVSFQRLDFQRMYRKRRASAHLCVVSKFHATIYALPGTTGALRQICQRGSPLRTVEKALLGAKVGLE